MLYGILIILINFNGIVLQQQTRIVGGRNTKIEDYPYHLSLYRDKKPLCGGALLSRTIGISAAHCFHRPGRYSVHLGSTNLQSDQFTIQRHVDKAIIHPNYDRTTQDYDVSLLFLNQSVEFTRFIRPLKLPQNNKQPLNCGEFANITGWGYINELVPGLVDHLRTTQVQIVDQQTCKRVYSKFVITPRMFCAGYPHRDSCQGDSGGALVVNNTIYGVISWGVGCGNPDYPGVYTNITAVRDFIRIYSGL